MRDLPEVGSLFGAPMGRRNETVDTGFPVPFEIERLDWVDGAYDQGGAYWGRSGGDYIYRAEGNSGTAVEKVFVRARTLADAKEAVLRTYPLATFAPSAGLKAFAASYREAALWLLAEDLWQEGPEGALEMPDCRSVSPALAASMLEDCEAFLEAGGYLIEQAAGSHGYGVEQAGQDFWLTRNHHGAGFWDRGLGKLGSELTLVANRHPPVELHLGDDGMVHDGLERAVLAHPATTGW